ncbi:hypothetical protein DLM_2362 [Aquitalea magnusonii]|uniref:Uncharacterized protein n=1 Tax=Aquitalea magnusonii TaxID=332411 RepID=A0A3G9GKW5_9NEIS|nr:hypothetical protein DLM_2362 [Aquitalea magnusonii]
MLHVSQSDVGTGRRVIQATVRVLLDDPFFNTHVTLPDYCRWCCASAIYHKYNKLEQNFYALFAAHATFHLHCAVQYKKIIFRDQSTQSLSVISTKSNDEG